jgi:hypothetical protein
LRDVNTRSTFRFNARMTRMRAIIVGPPRATSISASIAACHSAPYAVFLQRFTASIVRDVAMARAGGVIRSA